jgi:glycyl-tRNA synthetase beta chain
VAELLLEIGLEEIPAPWLEGLAGQLKTHFAAAAGREFLEPGEVQVAWAPRRLALGAQVLKRQKDREERLFGPPVKAARTASGEWTPAALGFAKKNGCRPEDLSEGRKEGSPEPYLVFTRKTAGRPAGDVLPPVLAATLRSLAFPKRMSWDAWLDDGKGAFPFGRPIRWLVALLDGVTVPFAIYEMKDGARGAVAVASADATGGHRFLPPGQAAGAIRVRSFADLKNKLAARFVLLDPSEREARIRKALASHSGHIRDDHGLPAEWRDLVEYPTVLFGQIPTEFQKLPTEVLETVLVHHQKYVPITNDGRAVSRFAAVVNRDDSNAREIVRGMERVVVARLRDAAFFFAEDLKRPLAERADDLAGVTLHQGLGSYKDKTARMLRLIDAMGPQMGLLTRYEHEGAREAASLAKADLTTLMVREFPELQGTMGGIYLRAQGGQREDVIRAVQWHYHPLSIEAEAAPAGKLHGSEATVFGAVSIADKLDSLAGYFGLGLVPTGSSDPFGLRRAAQGVVRVLIDFWNAASAEQRPSLRKLVAAAVAGHAGQQKRPPAEIAADLEAFLLDRLRYVLVARGHAADEVEAVLGAREPDALDDPHECALRLAALRRVRSEAKEDFAHLAVAFKRAKNILGDARPGAPDPALFEGDAERELHAAVTRLAASAGDYEARLRALATLRAPVDRFFDDVLVMAEDEKVRANRLGLLAQGLALFYRVADISRLAT